MISVRPVEIEAARGALIAGCEVVCIQRMPPGHPPLVWTSTREDVRSFIEESDASCSVDADGNRTRTAWHPPSSGGVLAIDPRELGHDAWLVVYHGVDCGHASIVGLRAC